MIQNFLNIIIILLLLNFFSACEDSLGVDTVKKTLIPLDSIDEIDKTVITYTFIDSVLDTVYVDLNNIDKPEKGTTLANTLVITEFLVEQNYQETNLYDSYWQSEHFEKHEDIRLIYNNDEVSSMYFELELIKETVIVPYEYFVSKIKFKLPEAKIDSRLNSYDYYNGLEYELTIGSRKGTSVELNSLENLFTLVIHEVVYNPKDPNIPMAVEFEIISKKLADYLKSSKPGYHYSFFGFNIHGLILFY